MFFAPLPLQPGVYYFVQAELGTQAVEAAEQKDALATELSVARTEHERALANMDQNSQVPYIHACCAQRSIASCSAC